MPGVIETVALIVSSVATSVFGANLLYLGTLALAYGGLAYGAAALQSLFVEKPSVPKPEDGSYNLKQNVPSLAFVLGRVKKGGDYVFLEQASGAAYHGIVMAAHRIQGYVQHYLHDEKVTLDGNGDVIAPAHFVRGSNRYVSILTRLGLNAETAYAQLVAAFPTIWSVDHRGDGLASILMIAKTTSQKTYLSVFPNQMPVPSSVIDGALLYDPRNGSTAFSRNLALMRYWHLTHPVGGKLSRDDMYAPDWANAANVGDQIVTNRTGGSERRYWGGLWFRAENNPVEVGRLMDQAAELVVFERPDGLIGVHAGEYEEPDIRLVAADIISASLDGNTRDSSTVLAVRGRYVDMSTDFNQADAAIYGDPYVGDDTERTKTLDNGAIQSHNHVQRLQKITFTRANAPRVSILAHYEPAKNVPYRRFVKVHYPPKMSEVVIEITSTPKLSLRNMTMEFSGIIVPPTLYAFNAAVEEGAPGSSVIPLPPDELAAPSGFNVVINREVVAGGQSACFGLASWTSAGDALTYELEWQPVDGSEPVRSVMSNAGDTSLRSAYLADGKQYKFRLYAWGGGTQSPPTADITRTATSDATAPGTPVNPQISFATPNVSFSARSANDNTRRLVFRRGTTAQSFAAATAIGTFEVTANQVISITDAPGAGTWKYWCGAENGSGVASAAQATLTQVVT